MHVFKIKMIFFEKPSAVEFFKNFHVVLETRECEYLKTFSDLLYIITKNIANVFVGRLNLKKN